VAMARVTAGDVAFGGEADQAGVGFLGCSSGQFAEPGTSLLARERLQRSGAIHLVHRRARTFVEIDPDPHSDIDDAPGERDRFTNRTAEVRRHVLPPGRILSTHRGLA
jgi:hypothetical protein